MDRDLEDMMRVKSINELKEYASKHDPEQIPTLFDIELHEDDK